MKTIVIALVLVVCVAATAGAMGPHDPTGLFPGPGSPCFDLSRPAHHCALERIERDMAWVAFGLFDMGEGQVGVEIMRDLVVSARQKNP